MENILSKMKELFGNSCYSYCLAYLNGNRTLKDLTKAVLEYWYKGYVADDGFVTQPQKIMNCKDVNKVQISKTSDIPSEPTIVEMQQPNGKDSHFVVCHFDGKKVILDFDPSGTSNSWTGQKFISYRKFIK